MELATKCSSPSKQMSRFHSKPHRPLQPSPPCPDTTTCGLFSAALWPLSGGCDLPSAHPQRCHALVSPHVEQGCVWKQQRGTPPGLKPKPGVRRASPWLTYRTQPVGLAVRDSRSRPSIIQESRWPGGGFEPRAFLPGDPGCSVQFGGI